MPGHSQAAKDFNAIVLKEPSARYCWRYKLSHFFVWPCRVEGLHEWAVCGRFARLPRPQLQCMEWGHRVSTRSADKNHHNHTKSSESHKILIITSESRESQQNNQNHTRSAESQQTYILSWLRPQLLYFEPGGGKPSALYQNPRSTHVSFFSTSSETKKDACL